MGNRRAEEDYEMSIREKARIIAPLSELSPEAINAIRERAQVATMERIQQLRRLEGCVDCPKMKTRKKKLIAAQVMNRLQGRIPSYCCELVGGRMEDIGSVR